MSTERDQRAIVDDAAIAILAGDRRLHAVVQDIHRHPTDRREGEHGDSAAGSAGHEAGEDGAGMAEHHQNSQTIRTIPGSSVKVVTEAGRSRPAPDGRCLEADLERLRWLSGRIAATKRFTAV